MDKIASKLDYLKGLLKGMELNGTKKNVIVEEIIEILDLMNKELATKESDTSLPFIQNRNMDYDYFNDKTMRRSDFKQPNDTADVWYDESISIARQPEHSVYKNNQKVVLEKICKHCGTYIRAEFSLDEYEKVKIQCPKCKHFMLPEGFTQDVYKDKTFNWDEEGNIPEKENSEFEEFSFTELAKEASRELNSSPNSDIIKEPVVKRAKNISFEQNVVEQDFVQQTLKTAQKEVCQDIELNSKELEELDLEQKVLLENERFVAEQEQVVEKTVEQEKLVDDELDINSSIAQVEDEILFNEFEIETDVFSPEKEPQVIKNVNDIEGEGFFKRFFKN